MTIIGGTERQSENRLPLLGNDATGGLNSEEDPGEDNPVAEVSSATDLRLVLEPTLLFTARLAWLL